MIAKTIKIAKQFLGVRKFHFLNKSQLHATNILTIVLTLIFIVLFSLWIKEKVTIITNIKENADINNFAVSLGNSVKKMDASSYESMKDFIFNMPPDVESVCFVDKTKKQNALVSSELNKIYDEKGYENVFFMPSKGLSPKKTNDFLLDESPLCIKNKNGKIRLYLMNKGAKTLLSINENEKERECVLLLYNGEPEKEMDIVFLSYGYSGIEGFSSDVSHYMNEVFLNISPFTENYEKFNFYRIDSTDELSCDIGDFIKCDEYKIKKLASNCPNDYIFVLVDRNKVLDYVKPVRSSAVSNLAKINTADNELVLMHEFAHIFADLADEYVDESYYASFNALEYPNCDRTECPKWKSVEGVGCFQGCSSNSFYRPTEESIMRNYFKSQEYGIVSEEEIIKNINYYG